MIDALTISQSGLTATQAWIDQISNNVSNMHTAGYKKSSVNFQDMVSTTAFTQNIGSRSLGEQGGVGTHLGAASTDFSEGAFQQTSRLLDVAIKGAGLIEVELDNGDLAYTRVGRLMINAEGELANSSGNVLTDRIQIVPDYDALEITSEGIVIAHFQDGQSTVELGEIHLSKFANDEALLSIGDGLFVETEGSGSATQYASGNSGVGSFLQGYLEMSNVELVDEMTNLVLAQRAYQLNARIIQTADQILETINNLRR